MWIAIVGIIFGLAAVFMLLFGGRTDTRLMKSAQDIAMSSTEELENLRKVLLEVAKSHFDHSVITQLNIMLIAQLGYIHDMVGIIACTGLNNPQPILESLSRIAFAPEFDFNTYAIRIANTLNKQAASMPAGTMSKDMLREIELIKGQIGEAADAVMPLRNKLAREFTKAGLTWTSKE